MNRINKITIAITTSFYVLVLPYTVFGADGTDSTGGTGGGLSTFSSSVNTFKDIVDALIPIAAGLALVFFFWGLAKYILNAGDEEKKQEGRNIMIWGVIAMFIIVSIFGIIALFGNIFGVKQGGTLDVPDINLPRVITN